MSSRKQGALLLIVAGMATGTPALAQVTTGTTPDVVSTSDPSQRYATFVPSNYDPRRAWPLVLIMDARGQALVPLGRMTEAADELGFILMSSYNTASDGDAEPNVQAVAAMIEDAQGLFSVDPRRLYFAGHSGTARQSWIFAEEYPDNTAGIIGFGAGLPGPGQLVAMLLGGTPGFVFFGGAGDMDYNYEEVRHLDWTLDNYGVTHAVEFYPGTHAWPQGDVFAHALEWVEVQAVRQGLSARTGAELEELYSRSLARADRREAAGDHEAAWRISLQAAADFQGLAKTEGAVARMVRLERAAMTRTEQLRGEYLARRDFDARVAKVVERAETSRRPIDIGDAARELRLDELRRRTDRVDAPNEAHAAQRMLESVFVRTSFYRPREALANGDWEMANAYLRLADVIKPRNAYVCLDLARSYAQLGQQPQALDALECAVQGGISVDSTLAADPLLSPLWTQERYRALMAPRPRTPLRQ